MDRATKYLTYTPWPGELNNTRMCYETALVMAYLSGRCLVMPAEYRRHDEPEVAAGKFRPLHPHEYFQRETLAGVVPVIERDEFDRRSLPTDRFDQADLIFAPGTSVFCFPAIPTTGSPEAETLIDFAGSRQRMIEITREMEACRTLNVESPALEHFYSFFYFSQPHVEAACKRLVKTHVRFQPAIISSAEKIARSLGNYAAVHVRRNDFFRQYPEQDISPFQLIETIGKHVPAGSRLYIATDETDRDFFNEFQQRYEVSFLADFNRLIPENLHPGARACVEQMVCASAGVFIGTKLSTFSGYITRLRGYLGAADRNTYFTDGSPGSEMDDCGSPRFSWTNWLRSGGPMWGREFKEGWEF